jgi:hypothetical protein
MHFQIIITTPIYACLIKKLQKNEKFKAILKVYYMLNDIIVKINNNYDFLIRQTSKT